eukprot:gene8354-10261_t
MKTNNLKLLVFALLIVICVEIAYSHPHPTKSPKPTKTPSPTPSNTPNITETPTPTPTSTPTPEASFIDWMIQNNKSYTNEEFQMRFDLFKSNFEFVNNFNSDPNSTYTLALNQFSDWTDEERKSLTNKVKIDLDFHRDSESDSDSSNSSSSSEPKKKNEKGKDKCKSVMNGESSDSKQGLLRFPASVDWRRQGIVTPAKNQGHCGSGYSFGVVSAVESAIALKTGKRLDLSSTQRHSPCGVRNGPHGKGLKFRSVSPFNERDLAEAVSKYGPMVVRISGENRDFQLFKGGIYDNPRCPKEVDHVVTIIGFGTENGKDYWLIKNSWGTTWGEGGIGKILRGVNQCGIVSDHSWSVSL